MASAGKLISRARIARDLTQTELARRASISRQALGAIEADVYRPSVAIAIRLARELGASVENLFGESDDDASRLVEASWVDEAGPSAAPAHSRVALARVHNKVVAVPQPATHLTLSPAAGILQRARRLHADICTFQLPEEIDSTLLIAGCDPAVTILGDWLARRRSPVHLVALVCSSRMALRTVIDGRAHAAGVHLRDPKSGEYNLTAVNRALGKHRSVVVNFARWELGLATTASNKLAIRGFADLGRACIRVVNREQGSGARSALDEALAELDIAAERIAGYETEVGGHLEVALAIAAGQADVGVTIRIAAEAYGLTFIPIREERYDLVIMEHELESAPLKSMLDALSSRRLAREISQLCGYDTSQMGQLVARPASNTR